MVYCSHCGATNEDETAYRRSCGEALSRRRRMSRHTFDRIICF